MVLITSEDVYTADICGKCDQIIREGEEYDCGEAGCNPELNWAEIVVADIHGEPRELSRSELERIDESGLEM